MYTCHSHIYRENLSRLVAVTVATLTKHCLLAPRISKYAVKSTRKLTKRAASRQKRKRARMMQWRECSASMFLSHGLFDRNLLAIVNCSVYVELMAAVYPIISLFNCFSLLLIDGFSARGSFPMSAKIDPFKIQASLLA